MASFIDLDSLWRDRYTYPNPCDYEVTPGQLTTWIRAAREIKSTPNNTNTRPLEFSTEVQVVSLTLPYTPDLVLLPRIYLDVHSRVYPDRYLVSTIDNKVPEARFILIQNRVQFSDALVPLYVHYFCAMVQTVRFRRDDPLVIRITSRDGTPLPFFIDPLTGPADPAQQSLITLQLLPLIRDADIVPVDTAL